METIFKLSMALVVIGSIQIAFNSLSELNTALSKSNQKIITLALNK